MKDINMLDEKLNELQKRMQKHKKNMIKNDDYLHTGEISLIRFVHHYNKKFDKDPTLVVMSDVIGISQATVTTLADRLIKKGLLTKIVSPIDKRAKLLSLTDLGKTYLELNHIRHLEFLSDLSESLGDNDTKELIRLLDKVNIYLKNKNC